MDAQAIASAVVGALQAYEASGRKDATPAQGPYAHGPRGLFSLLQGEHPILSAMIQPKGLLSVLPILRADAHVTDFFDTLTGVTAGTGEEPEGLCDDPRMAGLKKLCTLAVPLGLQRLRTRPWNVVRAGKVKDQAESALALGAEFPGRLFTPDNFFPFTGAPTSGSEVSRSELGNRLFEMAVEFQRTIGPLLYTADPTNNPAGDPQDIGYKEPIGLDIWINEDNKRDARSSAVCKALNSDIKNFAYQNVAATGPSVKSIVLYLTQMFRYLRWNADRMGLSPVEFVIAMRPDLFDAISDLWPCSYMSARCVEPLSGANLTVINDDRNVRMRDEMRQGSYLLIDGMRVPVVLDMNIPEGNSTNDGANHAPGEYSSDIYIIPLTVMGGLRVTGFQYFDQRISVGTTVPFTRDNRLWATDNGMFLWNSTNTDLCHDLRATMEWRLILQTPQLAGRLTNVKYAPLQHLREHDPDALYYLDGGVTEQPIEKYYNQWTTTPEQF